MLVGGYTILFGTTWWATYTIIFFILSGVTYILALLTCEKRKRPTPCTTAESSYDQTETLSNRLAWERKPSEIKSPALTLKKDTHISKSTPKVDIPDEPVAPKCQSLPALDVETQRGPATTRDLRETEKIKDAMISMFPTAPPTFIDETTEKQPTVPVKVLTKIKVRRSIVGPDDSKENLAAKASNKGKSELKSRGRQNRSHVRSTVRKPEKDLKTAKSAYAGTEVNVSSKSKHDGLSVEKKPSAYDRYSASVASVKNPQIRKQFEQLLNRKEIQQILNSAEEETETASSRSKTGEAKQKGIPVKELPK